MDTIKLYILFFGAFFAAMVFMPLAIKLAHRYGVLDHPGHRKIHSTPMARLGGVAILVSAMAGVVVSYLYRPFAFDFNDWVKLAFILGTTSMAMMIGLADDVRDIKPRRKFVLQALVVTLFVVLGYRFEYLYIPGFQEVHLGWLAVPVTMFWIMAVWNGFNFMDGIDGLAGSVAASTLVVLGLIAVLLSDKPSTLLFLPVLAALLVFVLYNWRPAKIYLGDAGASGLGVLIATSLVAMGAGSCILCRHMNPGNLAPVAEPFRYKFFIVTLLVAYPALEVTISALRRGVKKFAYGRSMEWSEKEHIHHRLLKMNVRPTHICVMAAVFNLSLALAGYFVMNNQKALAVWIVMVAVSILTYLMPKLGFFDFLNPRLISRYQPHYVMAHSFITMQKAKMQLVRSLEELAQVIIQTSLEFGVQKFRFVVITGRSGVNPDSVSDPPISNFQFNISNCCSGGHDFVWSRPSDARVQILDFMDEKHAHRTIKERVELSEHRGEAGWTLESHGEEEGLDVEYRVLMNDFMRTALERAQELAPAGGDFTSREVLHDPANIIYLVDLKKRSGREKTLDLFKKRELS